MADTPPPDIPIEASDGSTPFGSPVIDLDEFRIRVGMPRGYLRQSCEHKRLTYSTTDRRVWCDDCERTVDNFDAFLVLTSHFHDITLKINGKLRKAEDALSATIVKRAAKTFDRAWSGHVMAPACPHCRRGLLPEDFAEGAASLCSAEIERARRAREKKQ